MKTLISDAVSVSTFSLGLFGGAVARGVVRKPYSPTAETRPTDRT